MPSEGLRVLDMLQLSKRYFCHPDMNGSHSIKRVLDSIWATGDFLWSHPWFAKYYQVDDAGRPRDPYTTLAMDSDLQLNNTIEETTMVKQSPMASVPCAHIRNSSTAAVGETRPTEHNWPKRSTATAALIPRRWS